MHPLIVVAGPTGSGKSELSLALAETFSGEIVNYDSVQVYRHFDIGSAKLPPDRRRGIAHHLIGVVEPDALFTAGDYARQAREAIAGIGSRGNLPVLAGGTGFYLTALLDGLIDAPPRDEALRVDLARREARRKGSLHRLLTRFDPAAAQRIHANDVHKATRALEVILATRRPLTEIYATGRDRLEGYRILKIGLDPDRAELYARLDERVTAMFQAGLAQETAALAARYAKAAKPFESLGYAQSLALLEGKLTEPQAIAETQMQTRRYAKRQWTWFRRDPAMRWLRGFGPDPVVRARAAELVREVLAAE